MSVLESSSSREQVRSELPDLQDALLGGSQVYRYLQELDAVGCSVQVRVKSAFQERPSVLSLRELGGALERGEIHSAQLRYRFEGTAWVDTLVRTPRGIRLVRLDLDAVGGARRSSVPSTRTPELTPIEPASSRPPLG